MNQRILAKNHFISNDTRATGLNNNDLVIGPSGAGKTRGYVIPNILQCSGSMVIADTKGSLIHQVGPMLKSSGYDLLHLNFKDLDGSCGYNPLDYIRTDPKTGRCREQDILTVAAALVPNTAVHSDPYWEYAARMYLASMIAYVMECLPPREQTLEYVAQLHGEMNSGNFDRLMHELKASDPDSFAVRAYRFFEGNSKAEKMHASITGILGEKLMPLTFRGACDMYAAKQRLDFRQLGRKKTALFLTISDTDRSMDRLVSLLYTQAMHALCDSADMDYPDHRLPVSVRFLLDDFATNAFVPDFHNITSVIRSREIYVSIILQSITQLNSLYGEANAATIVNNCDNWLYLGGQDVDTARCISTKANRTVSTILNLPLDRAYLFTRGSEPRLVEKYDLRQHPNYCRLSEPAAPEKTEPQATPNPNQKGSEEYGL